MDGVHRSGSADRCRRGWGGFPRGRGLGVAREYRVCIEQYGAQAAFVADKGVCLIVKEKPEMEQVIPNAMLKTLIGKAARHYIEKHIGPKGELGTRQGCW